MNAFDLIPYSFATLGVLVAVLLEWSRRRK